MCKCEDGSSGPRVHRDPALADAGWTSCAGKFWIQERDCLSMYVKEQSRKTLVVSASVYLCHTHTHSFKAEDGSVVVKNTHSTCRGPGFNF